MKTKFNWMVYILKRITFLIPFLCFITFLSSVAYCEPIKKDKSNSQTNFTMKDFESVVLAVDRYYIDKKIDVDRAYTDAAVMALISLPHSLHLYPENYYNEREKFEEDEDIVPGKTFKLSPTDQFLIFDPDYKKVEQIRKKKLQKDVNKDSKKKNDDIKKLIEKEQARKAVLTSRWKQIKFSKKEFDRVITFIKDNLDKYKTSPLKEPNEEDESQKDEFGLKDVHLAAANGYLNSLDPHSNVFLKEIWEESMAKIQDGSFEGIGAILSGGGSKDVIVENPLEDRPAVKAGIRAGDVIVAVDGKKIKGMSLDKVVKRIKGKKDTTVKLLVKRKGVSEDFIIEVVRATITIKNVSYNLIKGHEHIGYIKLTGFVKSQKESSDEEIKNAYQELQKEARKKNSKLKGVVLDLRNNAGGYLDLAIDISDMFLSKGLIVSTKSPNRDVEEAWAKNNNDLTDLPLSILINAKSASASEIVASAIKHHGRGILLGERTFGKATVQRLMDLPGNGNYVLKITQSRYYSPSGKTIQVVGVDPDIEISSEEDGSFPFHYREENMWQHLPKIESEESSSPAKKHFDVEKIKEWVMKNGKADKFIKDHKNDPIKPDYQLIRSIDYVEGMISVSK